MRLVFALLSGLLLATLIVLAAEWLTAPANLVAPPVSPVAVSPTMAELLAPTVKVDWPARVAQAEAGDVDAQFSRAMSLLAGGFEPANPAEARQWFLRAADQGHGRSLNALGECATTGEFGPADHVLAARYFQEAWKADEPMGMFNLGLQAEHGLGRPRDTAEALRCFRLAADRGCAIALTRLGVISMKGALAPKDERLAIAYFRQAAEKGDALAWMNLAIAHREGEGVPASPTLALACARRAWVEGEVAAGFLVGELLTETGGDPAEALGYLLAARSQDSSPESVERFRRLSQPLLGKVETLEERQRMTDTECRLHAEQARRILGHILGR